MRKIIVICIAIAAALPVVAQKTKQEKKEERKQRINALIKQEEEGVIAYRKHSLFGFKLTNDGYGFFYEHGRAQSVKKALLFFVFCWLTDINEVAIKIFYNRINSPKLICWLFGKGNFFSTQFLCCFMAIISE